MSDDPADDASGRADDASGAPEDGDPGRDDPLGDFAASVDDSDDGHEERAERADTGAQDAEAESPADRRREGPLGELAASVGQRRDREPEPPEGVFTEEEVPDVDADAVWDQLESEEPAAASAPEARESTVVEKDGYCESCPHFEAPPAVACSHEGTEIVELVDMERFRVVNCPKVRENERLEGL